MVMSHEERRGRRQRIQRDYVETTDTITVIAARYGVSAATVSDAVAELPAETRAAHARQRGGPAGTRNPERDAKVIAEYLAGDTLATVGERWGMTRERVRQIVDRGATPEELLERIRNHRPAGPLIDVTPEQQADIEQRFHNLQGIADHLGVTTGVLRKREWRARGKKRFDVPIHRGGPHGSGGSLAELSALYREFAATNPPVHGLAECVAWANETGGDCRTYQMWQCVLRTAGIPVAEFIKSLGYTPAARYLSRPRADSVSSEEAWRAVCDFVRKVREVDEQPSIRRYEQWRGSSYPSRSTVIRAVGGLSWADIIRQACAMVWP